jgi:hypothetical protein
MLREMEDTSIKPTKDPPLLPGENIIERAENCIVKEGISIVLGCLISTDYREIFIAYGRVGEKMNIIVNCMSTDTFL